jgi:peptidoglycan-N-acetylglucosamine deacetylase
MSIPAKRIASLSLDLDNEWSYLRTHGDCGWEKFPSYLDVVVPRILDRLTHLRQTITFFVVGQDAALLKNRDSLSALAAAGHEIGNHSFHHEPWLHRYTREEIRAEIIRAEDAIGEATGTRPAGFRGPGYSFSRTTLEVLAERGYIYDASTFPTFIGPAARLYYFLTASLPDEEKKIRNALFGRLSDGLRPLHPYRWQLGSGSLVEIPVTTMPFTRLPIHMSYVLYLDSFSRSAARKYFALSLSMCMLANVAPSLLLHPLDFLGADDVGTLSFFPAMRMPAGRKLELVDELLSTFTKQFRVVPLIEHARATHGLPDVSPSYANA